MESDLSQEKGGKKIGKDKPRELSFWGGLTAGVSFQA